MDFFLYISLSTNIIFDKLAEEVTRTNSIGDKTFKRREVLFTKLDMMNQKIKSEGGQADRSQHASHKDDAVSDTPSNVTFSTDVKVWDPARDI